MNVKIENSFKPASGTQAYYQVPGISAQDTPLNPAEKSPVVAIAKDQEVVIHADDSCSLRFQMGPSTDFTLQLQKSGNQWKIKNTTGNTEVHVKVGPDGQ